MDQESHNTVHVQSRQRVLVRLALAMLRHSRALLRVTPMVGSRLFTKNSPTRAPITFPILVPGSTFLPHRCRRAETPRSYTFGPEFRLNSVGAEVLVAR